MKMNFSGKDPAKMTHKELLVAVEQLYVHHEYLLERLQELELRQREKSNAR